MRKEGRGMGTVIITTLTITVTLMMTTIIIKTKNQYYTTQAQHRTSYVNFVLFKFKNTWKPYNFREPFNA